MFWGVKAIADTYDTSQRDTCTFPNGTFHARCIYSHMKLATPIEFQLEKLQRRFVGPSETICLI